MASREYKRIMEKAVTVHSRNAHKLRIYDPTKWIMRAFAPRRRRLGMRKCRYYEQLEAVNSNRKQKNCGDDTIATLW